MGGRVMLPDSVYFGYYGNNDWRDYVSHSSGAWTKPVKYTAKKIINGVTRYVYDKKECWGVNRNKEYYRTNLYKDTDARVNPVKSSIGKHMASGSDYVEKRKEPSSPRQNDLRRIATGYRRVKQNTPGIKGLSSRDRVYDKFSRLNDDERERRYAESRSKGSTGKIGDKISLASADSKYYKTLVDTGEQARKILLDEAKRKKKKGVHSSVNKRTLTRNIASRNTENIHRKNHNKKPVSVKYAESIPVYG